MTGKQEGSDYLSFADHPGIDRIAQYFAVNHDRWPKLLA
jgi:hypothetical protein